MQQNARLPSGGYPSRHLDFDPQPSANGRLPVQNATLTPTSYASAYDALSSPASATFPHRAAASPASGLSISTTSLGTGSSSTRSPSVISGDHSSSRSPPILRADGTERLRSPPPDYTKSMSNLSFENGRGPLDDIPGIPLRGETSDLVDLAARWSQSEDHLGESV